MTDEQMQDYERLIALYDYEDALDRALDLIDVVTDIYGYNEETLDNLNYYFTGYRDYSQLKELEESEQKRGIL